MSAGRLSTRVAEGPEIKLAKSLDRLKRSATYPLKPRLWPFLGLAAPVSRLRVPTRLCLQSSGRHREILSIASGVFICVCATGNSTLL